jgi:hypothetical protein
MTQFMSESVDCKLLLTRRCSILPPPKGGSSSPPTPTGVEHRPEPQAKLLLDNLSALGDALVEGAAVTIEPTRVRVRRLPLGG